MSLIDIDRQILLEVAILQDKMTNAAIDFKQQWEVITAVREKTHLILFKEKNIDHPELPKLSDQIYNAMKVCNTKMIVMDDAMSRQAALFKHLVSMVEEKVDKF